MLDDFDVDAAVVLLVFVAIVLGLISKGPKWRWGGNYHGDEHRVDGRPAGWCSRLFWRWREQRDRFFGV